jgi:hypothetical protein
VTRDRSTVTERELRARAYELAAGISHPWEADRVVAKLARSGELTTRPPSMRSRSSMRPSHDPHLRRIAESARRARHKAISDAVSGLALH